jgi:hypothetical protein
MKNVDVFREKQQIDWLFQQIPRLPEDEEIRSHWAKYICVRISGWLENSTRLLLHRYATDCASPSICNFVEAQLRDFQNPKMEKILMLLQKFNPTWEHTIRIAVDGNPKDAVDSIVANRHLIAHGSSVGLSLGTIKNYYDQAIRVVEMLETHIC